MLQHAYEPQANSLAVIDDEPEILAIVGRAAQEMGFAVSATSDPDAFKTTIKEAAPSVVLLDLQMPGCDGVELLRFLHEEECDARIVLVSGMDARVLGIAKGVGERLGLDMAEPLQKPIRVAALRAVLQEFYKEQFVIDAEAVRAALRDGQIELYFQPLISLGQSRLTGWEALARWLHPERGVIMPDKFIHVAERGGLMPLLTDCVLDRAVTRLAEWNARGWHEFVSVNISAENLADLHFPDHVEHLCARHGVPRELLRLELTETAAMCNQARLVEVLMRLRLKGFRLAIDDFGTGYSSLLQLHRLPFSELKIDQSFVRHMLKSEEADIIVRTIVNLAHSLRLDLVAEGVETEETAARLAEVGCEIAQGYHFGRPMPADEVEAWREAHVAMLDRQAQGGARVD